MSNLTIIERIENKLQEHLTKKINGDDFGQYVMDSIEAMEGLDYMEIQKARDFQYKFEISGFSDEDPEIDNLEKVTNDFKNWLNNLKK